MKEYQLHRNILCIDLKSFYASVECAVRGLDPFRTPLIVADQGRGGGSIVLAVSPYLKARGLPSRCRIYEIPTDLPVIFAKPRMSLYLEFSTRIIEIYLRFISEDDLHIYSIDEAFLDVTSYLKYYGMSDLEMAKEILSTVLAETRINATCGIGPNLLISKLALDLESKKAPDAIAKWGYEDIEHKLWPVTPLSEMWGIGYNMQRNLNALGLYRVGDIARYDRKKLKKRFGILGEELYFHAHGIDMSLIQDRMKLAPRRKSYGIGQTLFHDYYVPDIFQVMLEMVDDVCRRLRYNRVGAKTIALGIGYSKSVGGGFSRRIMIEHPTTNEKKIYDLCLYLFRANYEGEPIRSISVSVTNLEKLRYYQYSLFEDAEAHLKEERLFSTIDRIKEAHGKNAVNRASSELESSTVKARNERIGGHNA